MVNYIRQQIKNGLGHALDLKTKEAFQDDVYLIPFLEDDALLYSLEDVIIHGEALNETPAVGE